MANTYITQQKVQWASQAADTALYFAGPSFNGLIKEGDDSSAQIFTLGMGSLVAFDSPNGGNHKLSFVVKVGSTAQYSTSTFVPKCYVDSQGRITLEGSGSIGGNSLYYKQYMAGLPRGNQCYIVMQLTNNTASAVSVVPTLIWASGNLQNFRWDTYGASDTDVITWDSTNKYMQITTPQISNAYIGIRACNSTQEYTAQAGWQDIISNYLGSGDLPNSIGTLGTSNYIWIENGSTASPTSISAGTTSTFVWAVCFDTTQSALQTRMAALSSVPTSDLTNYDTYYTATKPSLTMPDYQWLPFWYSLLLGLVNDLIYAQQLPDSSSTLRQGVPAISYTFLHPFSRDGYYGTVASLQLSGASAVIKDTYYLFKSYQSGSYAQMHEVGWYLNGSGEYTSPSNNGTPGDQDCFNILRAYEYYLHTLDSTFLTNEISELNSIGTYLYNFYQSTPGYNGLFLANGTAMYMDSASNISGQANVTSPIMMSLVIYTFQKLAELNTAAGNSSQATTWSGFAATLLSNFDQLWNTSTNWYNFNVSASGTVYNNQHIFCAVDPCVWGVATTQRAASIANTLATSSNWWDSTNYSFYEMNTSDSLYNASSYWYGEGWNITDLKAIETILRYGTPDNAKVAWARLKLICQSRLDILRGLPAEKYVNSGVAMFSAGAFQEMIARGIFGIIRTASGFTINPNTWKLNTGGPWVLTNYLMGNQRYTITVSGSGTQPSITAGGVPVSGVIPYGGNTTIQVNLPGRTPVK